MDNFWSKKLNFLVKVLAASFSVSIFLILLHYFLITPAINFLFSSKNEYNLDPLDWLEIFLTQIGIYWIFLFLLFCSFKKYSFFNNFLSFCIDIFLYLFMMPFLILFIEILLIFIFQLFENSLENVYLSKQIGEIACSIFSIIYFNFFISKELKFFTKD